MLFLPSMKAWVSARLDEAGRFSTQSTGPERRVLRTMRRPLPVTSATGIRAEVMDDLVERGLDGGQRGEMLDQPVAALLRFARMHGLAVDEDGPGEEMALLVGVGLVQLGREAVSEVAKT